ncbi:MAG: phosphotransferase [Brachybacterium tyrofermentans]|uniref:Phosphotransferase n=1 Tax=Brachybacterium tyrofermentans TaxID=47848 RepID=A0ABW0FG13_9MICO
MDDVARALEIAASLGVEGIRAEALPGGNQNHVVRVRSVDDDIVVRFARAPERSGDPFDVEAWCLRATARSGVRTSDLVARGRLEGLSYLVASYVPGEPAAPEDLQGWEAIGEFTSALRGISTRDAPDALFSRFGRDLDAAWEQHLVYNLASLEPDDPLISLGVYPRSRRCELRDVVVSVSTRKLPQGVIHGDAAHRNLLRDGGIYTVIDWGAASVGPVMWGDLERIFRWHRLGDKESPVSDAAWECVLEGAGLSRTEAEPVVRDLAAVHALDVVRWAIDIRPDRLDEIVADSRDVLAAMIFTPERSRS